MKTKITEELTAKVSAFMGFDCTLEYNNAEETEVIVSETCSLVTDTTLYHEDLCHVVRALPLDGKPLEGYFDEDGENFIG